MRAIPFLARDSFDAFKELVVRFPQSKYTPDALARMKYLVQSLAHHEVSVARWYMRLGAYVAANNRAQYALKTYPESAATEEGTIGPFAGETSIFITPGYRFRAVDILLTNFHLPRSTLFMLVSAFSGLETMKRAYAHAIESGYRFYSYGDACLLFRDKSIA